MKYFIAGLIVLLTFEFQEIAGQNEPANLMSGRYSTGELREILISREEWMPFPKITDREGWARADQGLLESAFNQALKYDDYEWKPIPATTTLMFVRTGDRNQYQNISFGKRRVLATLLIAEIYENEGRFIDQIIDGVWSICEESYWGVSAHIGQSRSGSGLPDVSDPYVDLFAAETATLLSWVDYFLGEKLDAVSPRIRERIHNEANHRIFTPVMSYDHPWMGFRKGARRPNNWNPWICSNWLNAALILEKDSNRRVEMVARILDVLDAYLNPHPQDGGCDEGPSYWGAAAASVYDNVSLLNLATNDAFDYVFMDEKIRNMGKYIYRSQISETYFMNFADADPQPGMAASMIWRYGKAIGDEDMQKFGAFYRREAIGNVGVWHFFRYFFELFLREEFDQAPIGLPLPSEVWLPDLEVMIARDREGSTDGFYVAAKGGDNDESHNHNDIGNYMVYYNGLPLIIDVGRGTYTAKTFSTRRYEIWYNRSDYHNLPTINGQTQSAGSAFRTSHASFTGRRGYSRLSLDIAPSYPESASLISWERTIMLNRGKSVVITDDARLSKAESIVQHIMTCWPAELVRPGEVVIRFRENDQPKDFILKYNPAQMEVEVEKIPLTEPEDQGIISKWGDRIHRINFTVREPELRNQFRFEISLR